MAEKIISGHKARIRILVEEYDVFSDGKEKKISSFIRRFLIQEKEHMPASFLAKVNGAMLALERLSFVEEDDA